MASARKCGPVKGGFSSLMATISKGDSIYRIAYCVMIIIIIVFIEKTTKDPAEAINFWISDQHFKGYVVNKYIDLSKTKGLDIIVIYEGYEGDKLDTYDVPDYNTFKNININDYIIKEQGSDKYIVIEGKDTMVFKTFFPSR